MSKLIAHLRAQWMGALALFLVIAGGTAYAANTIGSNDVIDNSLLSADLKNNQAVKSADVADGQLDGKDVGQLEVVNFTGTIGTIPANQCSSKKVTGLPVDNKDHYVITPNVTDSARDLSYTARYDESETGDMWIQVCNQTDAPIDDGTTHFNLLEIDSGR
jgi:hypothetical protein